VGGGIDQSAVVVLAVDLDQPGGDGLHQPRADRLIVDEGACPAVGVLHPPQDQFRIIDDFILAQGDAGRMVLGELQDRDDLAALAAIAHERGIPASAQREPKSIQQDRLAGARLAGQRGQTRIEAKIELIDQHNVADGQRAQHRQSSSSGDSPRCRDENKIATIVGES
jgi:hypothetical protein